MRAIAVGELDPVVVGERQSALRPDMREYLRGRHAVRVELVVPRRIERVGPVHAPAVAADLDHLRAARERAAVRVRRAAHDAADAHRPREHRVVRIRHVVLAHLAGAPARHVEEAIIERQVDVGHERRHGAESLQQRRQFVGRGRLGRDRRGLLHMELAAFAPPGPDRAFEIRRVDHDADEPVFAHRVVRGPHLERHLVMRAEIDRLHVAPRAQVPEMQPVPVLVREQVLGDDAVLELRRQRPFARHHVVARQVPPEVVVLVLRATVDLPAAEHVEGFAIHDEDAGRAVGAVLARAAERAHVDALGAAVHGVRARVAGLREDLAGFDDLVDARLRRMRLRVDHVDARRAQARDDQEAALEKRVARERRQRRRTGIPAEVVKLVAGVRHRDRVHDFSVGRRTGLHVDHGERVGSGKIGAQQQRIGKLFRRRLHRKLGRSVKRRVRPHAHGDALSMVWDRGRTAVRCGRAGRGGCAARDTPAGAIGRRMHASATRTAPCIRSGKRIKAMGRLAVPGATRVQGSAMAQSKRKPATRQRPGG